MVTKIMFAVAIGASAACSYGSSFVECEVACTLSTGCPPGFTCSASEGLCRSGATTPSCAEILDGGVDGGGDVGSTACPAIFGGARYLFVDMEVTWPVAEAHCKSLDSTPSDAPYVHLVVVNNAGELGQFMVPSSLDVWLGYSDSKLGIGTADPAKFLWITDEPGLAMWASGQPDDSSGPRCAYRDAADGLMHDRTCTNLRRIVCECDQFPENPNNI